METTQIVEIIAAAGAVIGGFFAGKGFEKAKTKKVEAETDSISVESAEKAVTFWENLNNRLSGELDNLRLQISEIKAENKKLHLENHELKVQVGRLTEEVKRLTSMAK